MSKTNLIVKHEGRQQNVQTTPHKGVSGKGVSELVTSIPPKREEAKMETALSDLPQELPNIILRILLWAGKKYISFGQKHIFLI